ncbi:hypothetical protein X777_12230 [Ooceraea biroi]|uniref:Uncharacterized protein n=1 Tax=Ooceraea biroi TaxID=2015173 RepID=A0A026W3B4_OOCBI|nr:hypothetical protein X777_12230 [Ooceraea biroi]
MPIAMKTSLSWIISRVVGDSDSCSPASSLQCRLEEELTSLVRKFWEQEEMQMGRLPLTDAEKQCEDLFVSTTLG